MNGRRTRAFLRNRTAVAGACVLALFVAAALLAGVLAPFDPESRVPGDDVLVRTQPSAAHLLGTDENGFDVFSRLLHGARTSLLTATASILLALAVAVPLGAFAGWRGGLAESAVMRATDVSLAFPSIFLAVVIAAIRNDRSLATVVYAVAAVSVPPLVRQVRAAVLQVKAQDYVTAAVALGIPPWRILVTTVLPNCMAPILVLATLGTGTAILDAAGLSFLGLGPPPTAPEWGVMLTNGSRYALDPSLWFLLVPPGAAIALTVLGFNLFGDGLRDALDPRTRV
ncbi:MAG: Glutathione transport system permease protein GsiD [Planctomycetes bacterium]|nr:Glutathione transport system permease protein GsiD [Planctomycetota bacterium]